MLRARVWLVLGACLAATALAQPAYEEPSGDTAYEAEQHYNDDDENGSLMDEPFLRNLISRLRNSVDAEGLVRLRRRGNIANGLLLTATGPVALAVSAFGLKLSNVVLSLYVTAFGGLLAGVELGLTPIAPWVAENLSYLTTARGRTALLAFAGNLVWAFGKAGLVPALLTCMNALFNANFRYLVALVQDVEPDEAVHVDGGLDDADLMAAAAAAAAQMGGFEEMSAEEVQEVE